MAWAVQRGAHTFFLRMSKVPRWGGYTVNLIHYEDAARLAAAVSLTPFDLQLQSCESPIVLPVSKACTQELTAVLSVADSQGTRQNLPGKVLPFVMFSLASLTCSATPGQTAAREEKPIAGLPGPNDKVEGVLPRVLPSGRTLLPIALRFCRVP